MQAEKESTSRNQQALRFFFHLFCNQVYISQLADKKKINNNPKFMSEYFIYEYLGTIFICHPKMIGSLKAINI